MPNKLAAAVDKVMAEKLKREAAEAKECSRKKSAQVKDLNRQIAKLQKDQDTAESIRQEIFGLAAHTPQAPDWIANTGGKPGSRGAPILLVSDIHYGEVIDPVQVGGVNQYNAKVADRRLRKLFERTVDLSYNHMGRSKTEYPGIVMPFLGDLIGGDIHEELMVTNDRTSLQSVNDLTDILTWGIDLMASKFGRVFVPVIVGNHGRTTKFPRFKGAVWSNYDWAIGCNLERVFRKEKHITIAVSNETDYHFKMYNHRFLATHGDNLGVKGGDGIIGAIGPIMRGSMKVSRSEAQIGRDFDTLLMAHWHQMLWLPNVIVNNCVKGYDEYARLKLRALYSRPSQGLFFLHPEHGITARWEVFLEGLQDNQKTGDWLTWK